MAIITVPYAQVDEIVYMQVLEVNGDMIQAKVVLRSLKPNFHTHVME